MGQPRLIDELTTDNWIAVLRAMAVMLRREGTTQTLTLERALIRSGRKRFRLVVEGDSAERLRTIDESWRKVRPSAQPSCAIRVEAGAAPSRRAGARRPHGAA